MTANSLYGQIGAQTSAIYLKDIAASTTATGRNLLYLAREKTEEKFEGAKIVYGDSIPEWEYLQILVNNVYIQDTVKNIRDKYFQYLHDDISQKRYYIPKEEKIIHTFTEKGVTPVLTLMEHHTQNDIIKVVTKSGTVNVTNEHSLLLENGDIITPEELKVGDTLMSYNDDKA